MKEHPIIFSTPMVQAILEGRKTMTRRIIKKDKCIYGNHGDRLWVRESYIEGKLNPFIYKADGWVGDKGFKSPMYMPKSAARLWLEIEEVRVETLHDISESDAISEGFASRDKFAAYWESLHGDFSYLEDPWVWVIKFRRVEK